MGDFVGFAVKKLAGKAIALIAPETPGIGWAVAVTEGLYKIASDQANAVRDRAGSIIKCVHLEVCCGWGPPTIDMYETALKKKGCAFFFDGVPLWHFQHNLDVRQLSARVLRYDSKTQNVDYYMMHLEACWSCSSRA